MDKILSPWGRIIICTEQSRPMQRASGPFTLTNQSSKEAFTESDFHERGRVEIEKVRKGGGGKPSGFRDHGDDDDVFLLCFSLVIVETGIASEVRNFSLSKIMMRWRFRLAGDALEDRPK